MARQLGGASGTGDELLDVPWQHRRGSALLCFVREDAAYLAGRVTSRAPAGQPAAADPSSPVP